MNRNKERIRLTTASVIIAVMLLTTKRSTVEHMTAYMTYDRFAALIIFCALTVVVTVLTMTVLEITKKDFAEAKAEASTGPNVPWVWGAMISARASALCVAVAATYDLVTSTPQTVWAAIIEWGTCLIMLCCTHNAVLKAEKELHIE